MKITKTKHLFLIALAFLTVSAQSVAQPVTNSVVGVQGYDLVSYQTGERPQRGNGNHVSNHNGVAYLFVSEENKSAFDGNPEKYLPAYGGYCAYGVSVGKKFIADPEVWEIVDSRLYLNLDNKIKGLWSKDIPENIKKAGQNWSEIRNKAPNEL